jgi:hypothetical protein
MVEEVEWAFRKEPRMGHNRCSTPGRSERGRTATFYFFDLPHGNVDFGRDGSRARVCGWQSGSAAPGDAAGRAEAPVPRARRCSAADLC